MNRLPFVKMEGAGNDYVYVDVFRDDPTRPVVRLLRDAKERPVRKITFVDLREKDPETGQYYDEVGKVVRDLNLRYLRARLPELSGTDAEAWSGPPTARWRTHL